MCLRGHHHRHDARHVIGRQHHRHIARQVGLRAQRIHLLTAGRARNHLHTDRGHALAGEGFDQIFLVEGVEVRNVNAARLELTDLRLTLACAIGAPCRRQPSKRSAIGANAGARGLIVCVADAGTGAGTRFDTTTSAPSRTNFLTVSAVAETRFSPGWVSRGMTSLHSEVRLIFWDHQDPGCVEISSRTDLTGFARQS